MYEKSLSISIVTATYNSSASISGCIASVNEQTIQDCEHIIIDGESTDNTIEIVRNIPNRVAKIICEHDNGIYDALNKGIRHATGDVIGLLHSDDVFGSSFTIEHMINHFVENNLDVAYGDLIYVEPNNPVKLIRFWKSKPFSLGLLNTGWMPPHPTIFIKKSVFQKHGQYNTNYKISADYEYMLRILLDTSLKVGYIPEIITKMAIGGISNKSIRNIVVKSTEDYEIIKGKGFPFPAGVLLLKNLRKLDQFFVRPPKA